jgi:hypothetical protein
MDGSRLNPQQRSVTKIYSSPGKQSTQWVFGASQCVVGGHSPASCRDGYDGYLQQPGVFQMSRELL